MYTHSDFSKCAYIYEQDDAGWSEVSKLRASDGMADDEFGYDVGLSNNLAVVGARFDDDAGNKSGSAYVYRRIAGVWVEEAKLTGQLQHPGIPPAHELGQLEDGSPFFVMKLIEGRTLAALAGHVGSRAQRGARVARCRLHEQALHVRQVEDVLVELHVQRPAARERELDKEARQAMKSANRVAD